MGNILNIFGKKEVRSFAEQLAEVKNIFKTSYDQAIALNAAIAEDIIGHQTQPRRADSNAALFGGFAQGAGNRVFAIFQMTAGKTPLASGMVAFAMPDQNLPLLADGNTDTDSGSIAHVFTGWHKRDR